VESLCFHWTKVNTFLYKLERLTFCHSILFFKQLVESANFLLSHLSL